jgi:hypothetical protein
VVNGGAEVLDRPHRVGSVLGVADVQHGYSEHRLAVQLLWDERLGRRDDHDAAGRQFVRRHVGPVPPAPQDFAGAVDLEIHRPEQPRMQNFRALPRHPDHRRSIYSSSVTPPLSFCERHPGSARPFSGADGVS